jgi:hypothetical protein
MENNRLNNTVDNFLNPKRVRNLSNDGMEREECDLMTGECYTCLLYTSPSPRDES